LNGELFVSSAVGAFIVLLAVVSLELALAVARPVVNTDVEPLLANGWTKGVVYFPDVLTAAPLNAEVTIDPDPETVVVCQSVTG